MGKLKAVRDQVRSFLFRNSTTRQTVAKNTVWLSISNFGGRILKAAVIIYAARALGTANWGIFSYAVTLAAFFTLFVDPGINAMLMREGSKTSENEQVVFLSTTFYVKLAILAACGMFILLVGPYFSTLPGAKALLPIAVIIIFGDALREFFSSFIRAREKMEWETGIFILTNACIVAFGFIAIFAAPNARAFGWAYAAGTSVGAILAIGALWPYISKIFSNFSSRLVVPIMRSAWPFAVTGALGALLTNADILIISWMRTASDVGVYSAAIRIIQILYLFPTVIVQYSVIPVFARLAFKDREKFREALEKTVGMVFAVSIPIAIGGALLGTEIMKLVFGNAYSAGGLSLKILMLTMIVDYPGAIISTAVFAYDRQRNLIVASAIGGISNVLLDLLFIPRFGITGSAVATLIAQTASSIYLWSMMKKINYFTILPRLKKAALAGVIMGICVYALFLAHTNLLVTIAAGALVYFAFLKVFRDPTLEEVAGILRPRRE